MTLPRPSVVLQKGTSTGVSLKLMARLEVCEIRGT